MNTKNFKKDFDNFITSNFNYYDDRLRWVWKEGVDGFKFTTVSPEFKNYIIKLLTEVKP